MADKEKAPTNYHRIVEKELESAPLDGRLLSPFATNETNVAILSKILNVVTVLEVDSYVVMKTLEEAFEATLDIVRSEGLEGDAKLIHALLALADQLRIQAENLRFDFTSPPKSAPVKYNGAAIDGDPYNFLMKHWGGWISRKLITFDKLKELDRALWLALRNKAQRDPEYPKPKTIFPSNKDYIKELERRM